MLSIPGHRVVNMSLVVIFEKLGVIAIQLIFRVSLGEFFLSFKKFGIMLLPIVVIQFLKGIQSLSKIGFLIGLSLPRTPLNQTQIRYRMGRGDSVFRWG